MDQDYRVTGKTLLKSSLILLITNISLKAMNFLLLPLFTKILNPEDYGISDIIINFCTILYYVGSLGLDWGFSTYFYDERTEAHFKKVFNTSFVLFLITSACTLLLLFASPYLSIFLLGASRYAPAIRISIIGTTLHLLYFAPALNLRMRSRMGITGLINIISLGANILTNLVCIVYLKLGYISLVIPVAVSHLVSWALNTIFTAKDTKLSLFDKTLAKKLLTYSVPVLPLLLMHWLLQSSDRYIIRYFFDNSEVGLYGVAAKFSVAVSLFAGTFLTAYSSFAYSNYKDEAAKKKFIQLLNITTILFILISLFGALFSPELIHFMTSQAAYYPAAKGIGLLLFASTAKHVADITSYGITFEKKGYKLTIVCAITATLNVSLNFLIVPLTGFVGAAFTTVLGYCVQALLTNMLANKLYPCKYEMGKLGVCFLLAIAIGYLCASWNILAKCGLYLLCFLTALYIFRDSIDILFVVMGKKKKIVLPEEKP